MIHTEQGPVNWQQRQWARYVFGIPKTSTYRQFLRYTLGMAVQRPKLSVTVSAKFSADDAAALENKALMAGVTRSALLRQAAIAGTITPPPLIPSINQVQWANLGRIGGNVNQIAARLNQGETLGRSTLAAAIEETRQAIAEVRSALLG